jgi:hypothetical protein
VAKLDEVLEKIRAERLRQLDLPGSELDSKNSPGDWIAMISHYAAREAMRNGLTPSAEAFEDAIIKAAAMVCAAFEHIDEMKGRDQLF